MNRIIRLRVGLVVVVATLSSCSDEGGQASPATTGPVAPRSSAASVADPFAATDRCVILDKALADENLPAGKISEVMREKGCDVDKPGFVSLGLVLDSDAPYDQVQADPSEVFDGKINGRNAVLVKFKHVERDCAISMQVTEMSHAFLVVALHEGTRKQACDLATRVMQKIEPQLPKG